MLRHLGSTILLFLSLMYFASALYIKNWYDASGENTVTSWARDPSVTYYYIGTSRGLVRVLTSDNSRVGIVPLIAGESAIESICIDSAGAFAYMAVNPSVAGTGLNIVQVSLGVSNFTRSATYTLYNVEAQNGICHFDSTGSFLFVGVNGPSASGPAQIVKMQINGIGSINRVGAISLQEQELNVYCVCIDSTRNYAYYGLENNYVAVIDLAAFARTSTSGQLNTALSGGGANVVSCVLDSTNNNFYFGTSTGYIFPVLKTNLGTALTVPIPKVTTGSVVGLVLDSTASILYGVASLSGTTGAVFSLNLPNSIVNSASTVDEYNAPMSVAPRVLLSGSGTTVTVIVAQTRANSAGRIFFYNNSLNKVANQQVILNEGIGLIQSNPYVDSTATYSYIPYVSGTTSFVHRIRMHDWTMMIRCPLNASETIASTVSDGTSMFAGLTNGNIVRFDYTCARSTTWTPTNVLANGAACNFLLQDSNYVYCLPSIGSVIARVLKTDSTQVSRVDFLSNEINVQKAVMDSTSSYIYVLTPQSPPNLVVIRLIDFVRVSVPQNLFTNGASSFSFAADFDIDANGNLYAVSNSSTYLQIWSFNVGTYNMNGNVTFTNSMLNDVSGYSIRVGPTGKTLYITANTNPSKLIRVNAATLTLIDDVYFNSTGNAFPAQTSAPFGAIFYKSPVLPVSNYFGTVSGAPYIFNVSDCNEGQIYDDATSSCVCCPAGQYLPLYGSQCLTCPQGYYCPSTCTVYPLSCPSGNSCPQASVNPTPCLSGYYSFGNAAQCTICPAGHYCNLTTVIPCIAGTYNNLTGQNSVASCVSCPAGTYSTAAGATSNITCTLCAPGYYSTKIGATSSAACLPCSAGAESDPTRSFCTLCIPGYANPQNGQICTACSPGYFTNSYGSLRCTACPSGQFQPNTTSTYCLSCLPGSSQSQTAQTACTPCSPGTFAPNLGQSACYNCPSGTYTNETGSISCLQCLPGFSSGIGTGVAGSSYCAACPPGTFNNLQTGTKECYSCPSGFYSASYNATSCSPCPAGTYANAPTVLAGQRSGSTFCIPCAAGTFNAIPGYSTCDPCPTGFYQPNQGQTTCIQCPSGTYSNNGLTRVSCEVCPAGTYSNDEVFVQMAQAGGACLQCPSGFIAPLPGSKNCTQCPDGYSDANSNMVCTPCPAGNYGKGGICMTCPSGFYTTIPGSTNCTRCPPGTFSIAGANGATTCTACHVGQYQANFGASSCFSCPAGTYSVGSVGLFNTFPVGASQCSLCPPGTFSISGASSCTYCAAGTFAPNVGTAVICENCPAGTFTSIVGSTNCSNCSAGSYSSGGATSCSLCSLNTFASMPGQSSCQPCPSGLFTSQSNGATECISCNDGEYPFSTIALTKCAKCSSGTYLAPGQRSTSCTLCPTGTYQSLPGQTSCTPCPAGTYGNPNVATNQPGHCELCPIGTFSSAGSTGCRTCPLGSFSYPPSQPGATTCQFCPAGHFSNIADGNNDVTTCLPCPAGTYIANAGSTNLINNTQNNYQIINQQSTFLSCIPCSIGYFASSSGSSQCLPCPQSTFADINGSIACKPCPGSSYHTLFGQTSISSCSSGCPIGYTNFALNTTGLSNADSCTPCPAGTFWGGFNSPCIPCPAGTYNPRVAQTQCFTCVNATSNALGSSLCCQNVTRGNSSSIVCSAAAGHGKLFNPMLLVAAILLALSALL